MEARLGAGVARHGQGRDRGRDQGQADVAAESVAVVGHPDAAAIEAAWRNGPDVRELVHDVADLFRQRPGARGRPYLILPEPQGVWALFCTLWVLAITSRTVGVFPTILLEGPTERGKSRLGKALIALARRGMVSPSVTPATLFRMAEFHLFTLFVDVKDVPALMKPGSDFEGWSSAASSATRPCRGC